MSFGRLSSAFYFGVQKLRCGVNPSMIDFADELLHSSWGRIREYVNTRIMATHGLDLAALSKQPAMTRNSYRQLLDAQDEVVRFTRRESRHTSGSTGEPLQFSKDMEMVAWMDAAMWAAYRWHGITPGDPQLRFWGVPRDPTARIETVIRDYCLRRRRLGAFRIDAAACADYFHRVRDWGATHAYGYPSLMLSFANHCTDRGLPGAEIGLDVVLSTGELLTESTRSRLAKYFDCPVIDEYGCTESGILAFECDRGTSHLLPVAAWTTLEDAREIDTLQGEIVVTDLYGDFAPLVRYRLGDVARRRHVFDCECGRELPELEVTEGRIDSFIITPDGEEIYDAILAYTVPDDVAKFRAVQTDPARIEAEIVVASSGSVDEAVTACQRAWSRALGSTMTVRVRAVEEIDHDDSGKLRYFVPLDTGNATPLREEL